MRFVTWEYAKIDLEVKEFYDFGVFAI